MSDDRCQSNNLTNKSAPALLRQGFGGHKLFYVSLRSTRRANGGADRDRTDDLLLAKQALSQLSYGPFAPEARSSKQPLAPGALARGAKQKAAAEPRPQSGLRLSATSPAPAILRAADRSAKTVHWTVFVSSDGLPAEAHAETRLACQPKPEGRRLVGRGGFEPPTSRLSSARSNQLSYQPASVVRRQ